LRVNFEQKIKKYSNIKFSKIMKKRTIILFFSMSIAALACSKKESVEPEPVGVDCFSQVSLEFQKVSDAFVADPQSKAKCQNVVKVAGKFLNCPDVTTAQKKEYQAFIDSKPCD
jgi:hypothetical protein